MSSKMTLEDMFALDEAPVVDPDFRASVMRAIAERRLRVELAVMAAISVLLLIVLASSGDALLQTGLQTVASLDLPAIILLVIGAVAFLGHAIITRSLPLPRRFFG